MIAIAAPAANRVALDYRPLGTFRFLLALLVVAQHFTNMAPLAFQRIIVPLGLGSIAVLVFFAVSGFVIAEAIEAHYRGRPGAFLTNRLIRIFPPLLGTVALTALVYAVLFQLGPVRNPELGGAATLTPAILSAKNLIANAVFAIPGTKALGLGAEYSLVPVAWSIRTEILFYLVMAAAMLAPMRLFRPVLTVTGGLAMLGFAAVLISGRDAASLQFAPYFVFGVAVFYALSGSRIAIGVSLAAMFFAMLAFAGNDQILSAELIAQFGAPNTPARYAILIAALISIPLLAGHRISGFTRIDRFLGDMSYPLYLNHCIVLLAVRAFWPKVSMGGVALATLAAVALSWGMYRLSEPGPVSLRNRVRGGRALGTASAGRKPVALTGALAPARVTRLSI